MKTLKKNNIISFLCVLLITITAATSITAMASTQSGIATIKANGTTSTIGNVSKDAKVSYSTIFCRRSDGQSNSFSFYVWVKDTTNSTVLSDKKALVAGNTSVGHWIPYKTGVSFSVGHNIRFYGAQYQSSSKGLRYTIYGDKAAI